MSMACDELEALVPRPAISSSGHSWDEIEDILGLRLPSDYKRIVQDYGPGTFDRFLWVLQPSSNKYIDLLRQCHVRLDALRVLAESGEAVPYDLSRGREEIIPWAFTDNGDVCFWVTSSSDDPDEWTIAVNEGREPLWMTFGGSASEFLVAVLSRNLQVEMFPDNFPYDIHTFSPLAA